MTAIASPEFIALCRTQLQLLTQKLTQSSAALYIADIASQSSDSSKFVPVVSYPEPVESWVVNFERASSVNFDASGEPRDGSDATFPSRLALPGSATADSTTGRATDSTLVPAAGQGAAFRWPKALHPEQRLVTPLVYTDVVVGLLVAVRADRAWNSDEREHIETVGASLAGGCVLERRNQWLQGQLAHKRGLQSRQSEVFHNLLHQFRNPLTAVSTFGQLMVKRIGADDPNAPIATGIVRENKRLRELVSHFDEAVAIGDADLAADSGATENPAAGNSAAGLLRPQVVPQPSLLPASAMSSDPDEGYESHEAHGLGQPLTLSAQYLPDIVEPVLAIAGIVATEKGVRLQSQVATDTPSVWGEEEALGEVITNLVDNAIKYSPAGAMVWVQTGVSRDGRDQGDSAGGSYQGIVVGDTGPGIPAADLPRLFERNYRGIQAAGDIPGTGLGLAIAQSLIQEMQGFIDVISPAVGTPWMPVAQSTDQTSGGSVFVVWLREVDHVADSLER